ncbi:hypothetical protein JOD14_001936 [Enterococcus lemanii]|nr:hypothetical protein [Enterococcus lemanii]
MTKRKNVKQFNHMCNMMAMCHHVLWQPIR